MIGNKILIKNRIKIYIDIFTVIETESLSINLKFTKTLKMKDMRKIFKTSYYFPLLEHYLVQWRILN